MVSGIYEPVYVVEWDPASLSCSIAASEAASTVSWTAPIADERRYAMRQTKQRLHQSMFRQRVIDAYGRRCALTGLPEVMLIDAAHIIPDRDADRGQPDIQNGICMSKLHHAAFDAGLIGIDPDFQIHVSDRLLAQHDGPMLEQGLKALAGRQICVPKNAIFRPDRDRLAFRFEQFRDAA